VFGAPLLSLSLVVLRLITLLSLLVASNTGNGAANGAGHSVANAANIVVDLAFGFLLLTLLILVAAGSLDRLKRCISG
jgi:uncharacterized membrane protein (DUF485 family)